MMTQEELDREYVDCPAAAKILKVSSAWVRTLCAKKRFPGTLKVGTSGWLIPRETVLNYKPSPRGKKARVARREDDRALIRSALEEAAKTRPQ